MSLYGYGIAGQQAPIWEVAAWFNLSENQSRLDLPDLTGKVIYLYGFQAWCAGCHSHGFPTLKIVREKFKDAVDVAFVAVQTVFEGFEENTFARAQEVAQQYQLNIRLATTPASFNRLKPFPQSRRGAANPIASVAAIINAGNGQG